MADTPTLDIIIPHYRETEAQMAPLMSLIASQIGVKYGTLGVIVVTDGGGTPLSDGYLRKYEELASDSGTRFRQITKTEDKGPGPMRQTGIDASKADYVFFVDADDRLYSVTEMREFQQFAKSQQAFPDIVNSFFVEQLLNPTTGETFFLRHNPDNTFLHGRFWRRLALVEGNFRFPDELRHHEDSYFNSLVLANVKSQAMLETVTYVWVYNPNSVTKRKYRYGFLMEAIPELVKSTDLLIAEYERRQTPGRQLHAIGAMFYVYYLLQCPFWSAAASDPDAAKLRKEDERIFYDMVGRYQHCFDVCDRAQVLQLKDTERQIARNSCGFESEFETWDQILRRLSAEYAPKPAPAPEAPKAEAPAPEAPKAE
jgi:glycosyltransferase involved in cell wall biosynthesis